MFLYSFSGEISLVRSWFSTICIYQKCYLVKVQCTSVEAHWWPIGTRLISVSVTFTGALNPYSNYSSRRQPWQGIKWSANSLKENLLILVITRQFGCYRVAIESHIATIQLHVFSMKATSPMEFKPPLKPYIHVLLYFTLGQVSLNSKYSHHLLVDYIYIFPYRKMCNYFQIAHFLGQWLHTFSTIAHLFNQSEACMFQT